MTKSKIILIAITMLIIAGIFILSLMTGNWVYSAGIIGLLFGFAMQKGSFCGASIMSSVVLLRDYKGIKAFFALIAVSMAGFATMSMIGLIELSPKGLNILPMAIGGFLFGIGTVLGGGCISGSLYKAGEGRLNSILALLGIGVGTNMEKSGVLSGLSGSIKAATAQIKFPESLDRLTGVDYSIWAFGIAIIIAIILFVTRKPRKSSNDTALFHSICCGKWSIITSGIVIGVIAWLSYLSSAASGRNYPLGVTGGVMALAAFIVGVKVKFSWWLFLEVLAIITGSAISAKLSGDLKFRSADPQTLLIALLGGVIMGFGASLAHGCFIGNMTSGWALLSIGSLFAGIFTILGNWLATYYYLRGK